MTRIRPSDLLACERALNRITNAASFECKELAQFAIKSVEKDKREFFESLVKRRVLNREPLQYITKEWDFSILQNIQVRSPVLIPRPETEELVRLIEIYIRRDFLDGKTANIIEIGTGCGAISISLLKLFDLDQIQNILGIEINKDAYNLPLENATKFNVGKRLQVLNKDFFQWIKEYDKNGINSIKPEYDENGSNVINRNTNPHPFFNILISNPPYIPENEMNILEPEVIKWESKEALFGGSSNGLEFTLKMLQSLGKSTLLSNSSSLAFFEVHYTHPALLISILQPSSRGSRMILPPVSPYGKDVSIEIPHLDTLQDFVSEEEVQELRQSWQFKSAYSDFREMPRFIVLTRHKRGLSLE